MRVCVSMTEKNAETFKELGGSKWLAEAIDLARISPAERIDKIAQKIQLEEMREIASLASIISSAEKDPVGDEITKEVSIICEALQRLRKAAQMAENW